TPGVLPVPASFVTLSFPVIAPSGTVALTIVALSRVAATVTLPPNVTETLPLKFVPLIVTSVPTGPDAGVNAAGFGGWITTRSAALTPVPSAVVTLIFPVIANSGTM